MRQLIQNLKSGETLIEEVPVPRPGRGQVLIKTTHSLVSLGTEGMLVEFGKANLESVVGYNTEMHRECARGGKSGAKRPVCEILFA